ncbi:TetR/AcrR family transcriptional regulator [Mucilaginibacter myungsuensis]|uniref:TetR/AcrR family transcriptional regulator n=1 Tax=Mucilaginibacter myungsuensis TaxID=649104 RepID=A0A929L4H5_9SPHI|nr:TetR/AcrR family transcriptional regulator [Mucilaginibacter myungsuensis]MBE9663076.1 TetR/AcrR family transcriptional regulator [Mucilaginibacter myungsuensis]MDN3598711.1 TetR/AcrR family transcriptional regulator [Mucilaginibacter myungsuensis]
MRDKEQTKRKLINAVAQVFKNEGYAGLGVNKIARLAGTDKKLIYRYFGTFEGLVEAYVVETDYWMRFADQLNELRVPEGMEEMKRLLGYILKNQFLYFYEDKEMQQLIFWELAAKSDLMRSIHQTREVKGQQLLEMTDHYLEKGKVNFRAIAALLVGGIYYMILHTRNNGSMFSDIDLSKPDGRQDILNAIDAILDMTFKLSNGSTVDDIAQ